MRELFDIKYLYRNIQDSQPVGAVMLLKYDVEQTPELRVHSFAIKKQGAPTLRLAADTEEAAARWTVVIREAVERNNQVDKANKLARNLGMWHK